MHIIKLIKGREIIDSRGVPTIEVEVTLENTNCIGRASVPSGASVGSKEAFELRDGGRRYCGFGVLKAVANASKIIASNVIGKHFKDQRAFDQALIALDGTQNKSKLGANTMLATSIAFAKACATTCNMELFQYMGNIYNQADNSHYLTHINRLLPMVNVINGGQHADNELDIQEFMIIPIVGNSIKDRIQVISEVFQTLRKELKKNGFGVNVGDEGGFAPNFSSPEEAIDAICTAILNAGYNFDDVKLAIDAAASSFYEDNGLYFMKGINQKFSSCELIAYYETLIKKYPIISLEDPLAENDSIGWKEITKRIAHKVQLVGDDIFVTNAHIFQKAIKENIANAIIIKPNQIGTLSEATSTITLAHDNHYNTVISHRSGETEDTTIAHLAVAFGSAYIKAGSISRTDRVSKYNELLRIYDTLVETQ